MKCRAIECLFIGMLLFASVSCHDQDEEQDSFVNAAYAIGVPASAAQAAEKDLQGFLKLIPEQDLEQFNFSNLAEVERAQLGTPFKQYAIDPQAILAYTPETDINAIITPMDIWHFPVMVDGAMRTLLAVEKREGEWEAVTIGSSGLAKAWETIQNNAKEEGISELKFISLFQAAMDMALRVDPQGNSLIIPLEWNPTTSTFEVGKGYAPSEMMLILRECLQKKYEPRE